MKKLFILSLLLLPFFAFSQNEKVSFSIEGTVGWSDVLLSNDGTVLPEIQSLWADLYKGRLSYDIGGLMTLAISEKINFQTGVKAIYFKTTTGKRDLRWGSQHDGNGGFIEGSETFDYELINSSLHVELPLRFNFQLTKRTKRLQLSIAQSPTFNVINTSKSISSFPDLDRGTTIDEYEVVDRRVNFNTQIGLIWQKELKKGNSFYLFPNVRIQTLSRYIETPLKRRDVFFGLTGGISI